MNRMKRLELKNVCEIQRRTEERKKRAQFNLMRTLNRLSLVSDHFLSTEYYQKILRQIR
jgi:hypothetical protein